MKNYTMEDLLKDHFRGKQILPFMTVRSMSERWGKSRHDVYNWSRRDEKFPKPITGIVKGLARNESIYPFYEVERYEQEKNLREVNASEIQSDV